MNERKTLNTVFSFNNYYEDRTMTEDKHILVLNETKLNKPSYKLIKIQMWEILKILSLSDFQMT